MVYTIQITQPAGYEEIHFAREYLKDLPAVLVLTKCDQADEEDFEDALREIHATYGILPWKAILVSGRNMLEEGLGSLPDFAKWWDSQGMDIALTACQDRQKGFTLQWVDMVDTLLKIRSQETQNEIELIEQGFQSEASIEATNALQKQIERRARTMVQQAESLYNKQYRDLHERILSCVEQSLVHISHPDQFNFPVLKYRIQEYIEQWEEETKEFIHSELQQEFFLIRDDLEKLIKTIGKFGRSASIEQNTSVTLQYAPEYQTEPVLTRIVESTISQTESILISSAAGMGGLYATSYVGMLLFGATLAPLALLAGAVTAWKTYERTSENSIERQRAEMRSEIVGWLRPIEASIVARYCDECQNILHEIRSRLRPYEAILRQLRQSSILMVSEENQARYHDLIVKLDGIQQIQVEFSDIVRQLMEAVYSNAQLKLLPSE